jgi:hypothetical protein
MGYGNQYPRQGTQVNFSSNKRFEWDASSGTLRKQASLALSAPLNRPVLHQSDARAEKIPAAGAWAVRNGVFLQRR